MLRALSYSLIVSGLFVTGVGVHSVWTSWSGEQESLEQWERQTALLQPSTVERGATLARLSIARLNRRWVVLEGADRAELKRAPGHPAGTALPGARGNCVIAGHRDTHFRALRNVEIGEEILLEKDGRSYLYKVTDTQIVEPTDTRSLDPTKTATLTLVTCYPFYYVGPAPRRFVIRAQLAAEFPAGS